MSDFFISRKVEKPQFNLLPEGVQVVRLIRYEETDTFSKFNGDAKDELPAWKDAIAQLAITVVSAEAGKSGGMTHRLQAEGRVKYSELSAEQKESGDYEEVGGYACTLNEDDMLVRLHSPEHTKECDNIINQFAASIGAKEGESLGVAMDRAIANQVAFSVTVVNKPYNGKDQFRLERFKAVKAAVPELTE